MEIEHIGKKSSHTQKEASLFSYLRKKNAKLYNMLVKLPHRNQQLKNQQQNLSRPMSRKPFMKKVTEEKRILQQKFDIIRQSIESKKVNNSISNEEIIKECNTLGIKNIAQKYSEYKVKEGFDIMQSKLRMQNMRHTAVDGHIYYNKLNRTTSGISRKPLVVIDTTIQDEVFRSLKDQHLRAEPIFITLPMTPSISQVKRTDPVVVRKSVSTTNQNVLHLSTNNILARLESSQTIVNFTQKVIRKSKLNPDYQKQAPRISRCSTRQHLTINDTSFY